ncbi:hypothetical protein ACLESO_31460 [Pyxidicoccus sp. 3LG]
MNRTPASSRSHVWMARPFIPGALLLLGLLVWAGGCTVEDPVAYILPPDSGTGPLSTEDGGWPDDAWVLPQEGVPADCVGAEPDAGVPCEDAGTAGE